MFIFKKTLLKNFLMLTVIMYVGGLIFMLLESKQAESLLSPKKEILNLKSMITQKSNLTMDKVNSLFNRMEKAILENGVKEPYIWDYYESCFFVGSLLTTIGYGHISPKTRAGRTFSMTLSLIGIPLTVLVVRNFSATITETVLEIVHLLFKAGKKFKISKRANSKLANHLKVSLSPKLRSKVRAWTDPERRKKEMYRFSSSDRKVRVASIIVLVLLVLVYLIISSVLRVVLEGWSMNESVYFWFMTLTTVGFGDYVPFEGRKPRQLAVTIVYYTGTFYLIFGLALIASLVQNMSVLLEGRLPAVVDVQQSKNGDHSETETSTTTVTPEQRVDIHVEHKHSHFLARATNGGKETGEVVSCAILDTSANLFGYIVPAEAQDKLS